MTRGSRSLATSLAVALILAGCVDRDAPPDTTNAASSGDARTSRPTDEWLGRWNGPEGTFLRLERSAVGYEITIQDLDGPRTYEGTAAGSRIQFDRNGVKEFIRATNGADTGMKWLRDKSNCLTIRPGEGYCRN